MIDKDKTRYYLVNFKIAFIYRNKLTLGIQLENMLLTWKGIAGYIDKKQSIPLSYQAFKIRPYLKYYI